MISSGNARSFSLPGLGSQPHSYPPPGLGFAAGFRPSSSARTDEGRDERNTSEDRSDDGGSNAASHQYDFRSLSHSAQTAPHKAFLDTPTSATASGLQPVPVRSWQPVARPIAIAADYDSILGPAEPVFPSSAPTQENQPHYPQQRDDSGSESGLGSLMYRFPTDAYNHMSSQSQHHRLAQGTQAHNIFPSPPTLSHRHSVHVPGYSNHQHTSVLPVLSRNSSEHFERYGHGREEHDRRMGHSPERAHLQRGLNGRASSPQKSDLGLESGQPDYFAALRLLAGSNGGTTELEALENATAAARMYGDDRSAFNDDAFLRHFADLALGDGHSAMRRDGVDMGFGPESGSGGAFQENNPHPSELSLPETTNSVIRPFLYDSFLSSATDFPDTSRDNLHYSHAQPRHHSHYTTSLETLRARAYRALGRDFADEFDSLTSAGSGHAIGSYPGLGRGYSTVPPPGYICKLCFVEGHWLKNCNLYQYRRRSEYFHNYPPNASAGMNTSSLSAAAAAAIARYDGLSISAALRGLSARHSPTHMQPSNRSVGKTTVPPDGYVCRKCHTPGHWIQQCTLPKQSVPPDGYTCKICLVKGHWIHQCPHRSGANGGDAQAAAAAVIRGGIAGF